MTRELKPYIPFSQRTRLTPIPPQLKLGEVSDELRRLIEYSIILEITRAVRSGYGSIILRSEWGRVGTDLHVRKRLTIGF